MPEISLTINNQNYTLSVDTCETLLDTLRDRLHLTGAKRGCDMGDCGSCTILLDGKPVNACLLLTLEADGSSITTIEGIKDDVIERFIECGSFQCGFCAPGIVVSSHALLESDPAPSGEKIKKSLSGHLCRCTGYIRVLKALKGEVEEFKADERFDVVGKPLPRKDIRDKVTGRAKFTADLYFPGLVYGALVTSPHPFARIKNIDSREAEALPGVLLVLTARDVSSTPYGVSPARYDETIFPCDTVRYAGEPVAAVFANSRRIAEMAAGRFSVEYEVLQGVFDPEEAIKEGSTLIHDRYPGNINTAINQDFGDFEEIAASSFYVREDTFRGQRTHQSFLEPQASLAMVEGDLINLWTANQSPHYVQLQVSRVLGIPASRLRVIKPAMGGGFGGKAEATKLDFLSVIAALKLGRPVLMTLDRKQVFEHNRGRHAQTIHLKSAFDGDGTLRGAHMKTSLDGGAYTSYGIITTYYSGCLITTPYLLPSFGFEGLRICTNLPTCGAQRGNGTPQPRWAFESQMDMAARELGLDPLAIRKKNVFGPGHKTVNELEIKSCGMKECLDEIEGISQFSLKYGKLPFGKGIGLGLGCFISGAGYPIIRGDLPHSSATIRAGEDGERVFLYTGAPEIGQGSDTVLCQIAAEELGIGFEDVIIISSDSAITPSDLGAYASRVTFMAGNAVIAAAREVKEKLADFWRSSIGALDPSGLIFKRGVVRSEDSCLEFGELARCYFREKGPLTGSGAYSPPKLGGSFKGAAVGTSPAYSFCAIAAEVNVDRETGRVSVEHFYAAHDSGTVINPVTFHGQVEGALVMGLGEALYEKVEHVEGRLRNPNFHDYLIPTIADTPEIHTVTVPVTDPSGPFGAKEVGEGTILPVMGAIANAVYDAVGVRIMSLPITAEKVYMSLREKQRVS